jgi:hypothetical protein
VADAGLRRGHCALYFTGGSTGLRLLGAEQARPTARARWGDRFASVARASVARGAPLRRASGGGEAARRLRTRQVGDQRRCAHRPSPPAPGRPAARGLDDASSSSASRCPASRWRYRASARHPANQGAGAERAPSPSRSRPPRVDRVAAATPGGRAPSSPSARRHELEHPGSNHCRRAIAARAGGAGARRAAARRRSRPAGAPSASAMAQPALGRTGCAAAARAQKAVGALTSSGSSAGTRSSRPAGGDVRSASGAAGVHTYCAAHAGFRPWGGRRARRLV